MEVSLVEGLSLLVSDGRGMVYIWCVDSSMNGPANGGDWGPLVIPSECLGVLQLQVPRAMTMLFRLYVSRVLPGAASTPPRQLFQQTYYCVFVYQAAINHG